MKMSLFIASLLLPAHGSADDQRCSVRTPSLALPIYLNMVEASLTREKLQMAIDRQTLAYQTAENNRKYRVDITASAGRRRSDQIFENNTQSSNLLNKSSSGSLDLTVTQPLPIGGELAMTYAPIRDMTRTTSGDETISSTTRTAPVRLALTLPLLKGNGQRNANNSVIQAELNVRSASLQHAMAMDSLMLSALNAYISALDAQEQLAAMQAAYQSAKDARHAAGERLRIGIATRADVTYADLSLLSAEGSVINAESGLANSLSAMAQTANCGNAWTARLLPINVSDDQLATTRLASVPVESSNEVRLAMLELESAEQSAYVAKDALLPELNLVLEKNRIASQISGVSPDGNNTATSSFIGFAFKKTLDDHNAKADVTNANSAVRDARINNQIVKNDLLLNRARIENELLISRHQIVSAQQYLSAAETNLQNENRKYALGRTSLNFVKDARDSLTNAQLTLNSTRTSYIRTVANYALHSGSLNELLNILKQHSR